MEVSLQLQQQVLDLLAKLITPESPPWYGSAIILIPIITALSTLAGAVATQYLNVRRETKSKLLEAQLRRQDSLYSLRSTALKDLYCLLRKIEPISWPSPDYEYDESLDDVVAKMGALISDLDYFLNNFAYILPEPVTTFLQRAVVICNQRHWGATRADDPEYSPNNQERELAEQARDSLWSAFKLLKQEIESPSKSLQH